MTRYAEKTAVPADRSKAEIEKTLQRYGATAFMSGQNASEAMIAFEASGRRVMFRLPLPDRMSKEVTHTDKGARRTDAQTEDAFQQAIRQRWRALALCIKAKLEAVATGITSFEDEFMAHIVMPDGGTVAEHVRPRIADAYKNERMVPLLPAPKS